MKSMLRTSAQNRSLGLSAESKEFVKTSIFSGSIFYVYAFSSAEDLRMKKLITQHGGSFSTIIARNRVYVIS